MFLPRITGYLLILAIALSVAMNFAAIPTLAQSQKLETEQLTITTSRGDFEFLVEIADEPEERTIGLMNRDHMENRSGMLFVFDRERVIQMWMKNTLIPLDMVFTSADGTVVTVAENTVPHSLDIVSSLMPVTHVLELNGGMAAFIGLKRGDKLNHAAFR